jgi:hypothetical protein
MKLKLSDAQVGRHTNITALCGTTGAVRFFSILANFHENSCPELKSQPFPFEIGSFSSH